MIKRLLVCLSAVFFAPLFFGGPALAADKVTISYVVPTVIYGDLLAGLDHGYFAEEGMDVSLLQAGGGAATCPPDAAMAGSGQAGSNPNTWEGPPVGFVIQRREGPSVPPDPHRESPCFPLAQIGRPAEAHGARFHTIMCGMDMLLYGKAP